MTAAMIVTGWRRLAMSAVVVAMATAVGPAAEDPEPQLVRTATLEVVAQDDGSPLARVELEGIVAVIVVAEIHVAAPSPGSPSSPDLPRRE